MGRFAHVKLSDNLLSTSVNLKQVAKPFVHRCFDNLTTFYKKSSIVNTLKRGFNSLKRDFSHHNFSVCLHHNSLRMREITI
mgnify:CR=1 FL=1